MPLSYTDLLERTRFLLKALAAGDALGSTSELKHHREIPHLYREKRDSGWPFRQTGGGPFNLKKGTPTDETGMAMVMFRSFKEVFGFHPEDVTGKMITWKRSNPVGLKPDVISALSWAACSDNWYDGGLHDYLHGPDVTGISCMGRNGVIAGMATDLEQAFKFTVQQCIMTDFTPMTVICCCAQTFLLMDLLGGGHPAENWRNELELLFRIWLSHETNLSVQLWRKTVGDRLEQDLQDFLAADLSTSSWNPLASDWSNRKECPMLTLRIALWALHWSISEEEFEVPHTYLPTEVFRMRGPFVLGWVALTGHHSDTYAAVAGPMLAAAHNGLPEGMTESLSILDGI